MTAIPRGVLEHDRIEAALAELHGDDIQVRSIGGALPPDLGLLAFHEAGHAVVARHLGLTVHSAIIEKAEDSPPSGLVHLRPPKGTRKSRDELKEGAALVPQLAQWDVFGCSFTAFYLAGFAAELVECGIELERNELIVRIESPDLINAMKWAGTVRQQAVLAACQRIALAILKQRWRAVVHIAELLRQQGRASQDEIEHLIFRGSVLM